MSVDDIALAEVHETQSFGVARAVPKRLVAERTALNGRYRRDIELEYVEVGGLVDDDLVVAEKLVVRGML